MVTSMGKPGKRKRNSPLIILAGAMLATGAAFVSQGVYIQAKAAIAQVLLDRAFLMPAGETAKPWPWADIEPIVKISAPRLGKHNVALSGTDGEALAFGPGHLAGSAQPGEMGTAVYSAHRDTHFSWIGDLQPGDRLVIETRDGRRLGYDVRRRWIARYDASGIDAEANEKLIALTTCWPFDAVEQGPLRFIVEAVAIDEPDHQSGQPST